MTGEGDDGAPQKDVPTPPTDEELRKIWERPVEEGGMGAVFSQFPEEHRELPAEIDTTKFGEDVDFADKGVKMLKLFIEMPVVSDAFVGGDHVGREDARKRITREIKEDYAKKGFGEEESAEITRRAVEIFTANKFKGNTLSNLNNAALMLSFAAQTPSTARIQEIYNEKVKRREETDPNDPEKTIQIDPWAETTPIETKREVIKELVDASVDALWEISEFKPKG